VYVAGLIIIPTVMGVLQSREIRRNFMEWDDYVILLIIMLSWPVVLGLVAIWGIGYVIGYVPFTLLKWWMKKCARCAEWWEERQVKKRVLENLMKEKKQ
jgi:hypothetical protein